MRRTPNHPAAFTLLEMILSLSVLSAVTAMVATMWTQAGAWSDQNSAHHAAMQLQRTIAFMHDQWADRRSAVDIAQDDAESEDQPPSRNPGVRAAPDALTFVTATSILDTAAPLVIARYEIQQSYNESLGTFTGSTLIYREQPVANLGEESTLEENPPSHALLEDCTNLVFERFGPPPTDEQDEPLEQEGVARAESAPSDWRIFDEPYDKPIPAVRVTGEYKGEPFSCVFVIEALR